MAAIRSLPSSTFPASRISSQCSRELPRTCDSCTKSSPYMAKTPRSGCLYSERESKMRNPLVPLIRFLLIATMFFAMPTYAQWAVVDVNAQAQWPIQIRTMVEQYNILKAQYEKLRQQVIEAERTNQSITGATGKAWLINGVAEQAERRWLPASWQDATAWQRRGWMAVRNAARQRGTKRRLKPSMPGSSSRACWATEQIGV